MQLTNNDQLKTDTYRELHVPLAAVGQYQVRRGGLPGKAWGHTCVRTHDIAQERDSGGSAGWPGTIDRGLLTRTFISMTLPHLCRTSGMMSEFAVVLYVNTCWTGVQHSIASVRAGTSALEDTNETNGSGVCLLDAGVRAGIVSAKHTILTPS